MPEEDDFKIVRKEVDDIAKSFDLLTESMKRTGVVQDGLANSLIQLTKTNTKFGRFWMGFNRMISGSGLWQAQNKFKGFIDFLHTWQIAEKKALEAEGERVKQFKEMRKQMEKMGKLKEDIDAFEKGDLDKEKAAKLMQNDTFKLLTATMGMHGAIEILKHRMNKADKLAQELRNKEYDKRAKLIRKDLKKNKEFKVAGYTLEMDMFKSLSKDQRRHIAKLTDLEERMQKAKELNLDEEFDELEKEKKALMKTMEEKGGASFLGDGSLGDIEGQKTAFKDKDMTWGIVDAINSMKESFKWGNEELQGELTQLKDLTSDHPLMQDLAYATDQLASSWHDRPQWEQAVLDAQEAVAERTQDVKDELGKESKFRAFVRKWEKRKDKFRNGIKTFNKFMTNKEFRREKIQAGMDKVKDKFQKMGGMKAIGNFLKTAIKFVGMAMLWGVAIVAGLWALKKLGVFDFLKSVFQVIIDTLGVMWEVGGEIIVSIVDWFVAIFDFVGALFSKDGDVWGSFWTLLEASWGVIWAIGGGLLKIAWALIGGILGALWDWFIQIFADGKTDLWSVLWGVAKFILTGIAIYIGFVILTMIGLPVIMAGALALAIGALFGSLFGWFSDGGITGGGLSVVGEKGPELVKLPAGTRVHSNKDSRRLAGNGNTNNISINVSGRVGANDTEIRDIAGKIGRQLNMELNRTTSTGTRGA